MTESDRIKIIEFLVDFRQHHQLVNYNFTIMLFGNANKQILTTGMDKDTDCALERYIRFGNIIVRNYETVEHLLNLVLNDTVQFNDKEFTNDGPDLKTKLPINCS